MLRFLKTTILGGVLFLVPVVIFLIVLGKAIQLTDKLATPIAAILPQDHFGGIAVVELIALGIVILVCFIAGLVAKSQSARRAVQLLETNVLENIPAYALVKAKSSSVLNPGDASGMQPVLVQFDDSWQVGLAVEKLGEQKSLIFLPGAPDAWSGSVCAVTSDRLQPLAMTVKEVGILMKRVGQGSPPALGDLLRASPARS